MAGVNRARRARWARKPAARSARVGLACVVASGLALSACGDDSDDEASQPRVEQTDLSQWREVPVDDLGFALSLPPRWEDVVLDADGMAVLSEADPGPAGFAASAQQAAAAGAVFYAAGGAGGAEEESDSGDGTGAVNDLKILAHADPDGSHDEDDLADLVDERVDVAETEGAESVEVDEVDDVDYPASDLRFRTTFPGGPDGEDTDEIVVEVVERVALAPSGVVYSAIVTGEDADTVDQLATDIFATLELL